MSNTSSGNSFAVVIPVYNHEQKIREVVLSALELGFPVIVVDDGSTDSIHERLADIKGITVLRHSQNRGKGAALKTGLAEASRTARWAITIDADGQHNPKDAHRLIDAIPEGKRPIVVGVREEMTGPDVPWTSTFGRQFSNFWVWMSGSRWVRDTQSGFRIYPLPETLHLDTRADRFQFEVEVLAKAGWHKMPVAEGTISVNYRPGMERISHFRPFMDFMRNTSTFARLITQRLFIPSILRRKLKL